MAQMILWKCPPDLNSDSGFIFERIKDGLAHEGVDGEFIDLDQSWDLLRVLFEVGAGESLRLGRPITGGRFLGNDLEYGVVSAHLDGNQVRTIAARLGAIDLESLWNSNEYSIRETFRGEMPIGLREELLGQAQELVDFYTQASASENGLLVLAYF